MDPLLTEFDANTRFGSFVRKLPFVRSLLPSTDLQGFGLAKTFFLLALIASVLSVLCNAGVFEVTLAYVGPPRPNAEAAATHVPLSFGYLYELNAAFLYLFVAPTFVFLGVRFVRNAQFALRGLAKRKFLTVNPKCPQTSPTPESPLVILGRMNRRIFRPVFLTIILVVAAWVIVSSEFKPGHGGDYWRLAFGYVQAPFLQSYKDKTLAELEKSGRGVNPISGIAPDENWKEHWKVEAVSRGGTWTKSEHWFFWIFIVFALAVQVLFVPFAIWIFFKALFLLRCLYKAISPTDEFPLEIKLDFADQDKTFGLTDLHQAYNYVVAIIFVGAVATASVVLANVPKGSHSMQGARTLSASIGQTTTTILPLILFFVLGAFFFFLRMKTEETKEQFVNNLDEQIAESIERDPELEEKRKLACAQTAWPDSIFKTWFGSALPSYIFPVVFLSKKPELAEAIYGTWISIADKFDSFIRWIGSFIGR